MKLRFEYWFFGGWFIAIGFVVFWMINTLNPDSRFCSYKIYKQSDEEYQVWWTGRSNIREFSGSYEQAKAFQIRKCDELKAFMFERPRGERVK